MFIIDHDHNYSQENFFIKTNTIEWDRYPYRNNY